MAVTGFSELAARRGVRQFAKFCIIGATSAVIDVGLLNFLTGVTGLHWIPAQVGSFAVAVTNGFVWNSLWTFRGMGAGSRHERYAKFVLVNIAGLLLNIAVMKAVFIVATGQLIYHGNPPPRLMNGAKGVAIVVVAFWNFLANKYWTFRHKRAETESSTR